MSVVAGKTAGVRKLAKCSSATVSLSGCLCGMRRVSVRRKVGVATMRPINQTASRE